jgi:hypothetical protein
MLTLKFVTDVYRKVKNCLTKQHTDRILLIKTDRKRTVVEKEKKGKDREMKSNGRESCAVALRRTIPQIFAC